MNEFIKINEGGLSVYLLKILVNVRDNTDDILSYWTLELAYHLDDAPWPATKDELIDYAIRSCAPLEVVENLEELEARTTNTTKNKPSMDTIGTINFLIA